MAPGTRGRLSVQIADVGASRLILDSWERVGHQLQGRGWRGSVHLSDEEDARQRFETDC